MKALVPGICYSTDDGTIITFQHKNDDGSLFRDATTTEEIIELLIHRLVEINKKKPCQENDESVLHLQLARGCQQMRQLRDQYIKETT